MNFGAIPWDLIGIVITSGAGLYGWLSSITSGLDRRLGKVEARFESLTEKIEHLPTAKEISDLRIIIARLDVTVGGVGSELRTLSRRFDLHEEAKLRREGP